MKKFESSSLSELDKKFLGEQSLLSALSLELCLSKSSNGTLADKSENGASPCPSMDTFSPCQEFLFHISNVQETDNCHLTVPSQVKFSTPMLLQRPKQATSFDQSYSDFTASQISWDVSLIKAENSPKFFTDSRAQEPTLSPKPQQCSVAEVSPWSWLVRGQIYWTFRQNSTICSLPYMTPALSSTFKMLKCECVWFFVFFALTNANKGESYFWHFIVAIHVNKTCTCSFKLAWSFSALQ